MANRRSTSLAFLADIGTNSVKAWRSCISLQPGRDVAAAVHLVELVGHSRTGMPGLSSDSTLASAGVKLPASTTNRTRSTSPTAPITVLFKRPVQRRAVARLEARRVDEDELRRAHGADAGDAVPGGLRLARGDADLLADQRVEQASTCRRWACRRWRPGRSAAPASVPVVAMVHSSLCAFRARQHGGGGGLFAGAARAADAALDRARVRLSRTRRRKSACGPRPASPTTR